MSPIHTVDLERVRALIEPVLRAHRVELFDLRLLTERGAWVLRVTLDAAGPAADAPATAAGRAGVTLEMCAEVSRDLSSLLDAADPIPHAYHLEVGSPGLDRPLAAPADFARARGRLARVKLSRPAPDGQRLLRGTLLAAPAGRVAVHVDGKRIEVAWEDVASANLVFELAAQPKKKNSRSSRKRS